MNKKRQKGTKQMDRENTDQSERKKEVENLNKGR